MSNPALLRKLKLRELKRLLLSLPVAKRKEIIRHARLRSQFKLIHGGRHE